MKESQMGKQAFKPTELALSVKRLSYLVECVYFLVKAFYESQEHDCDPKYFETIKKAYELVNINTPEQDEILIDQSHTLLFRSTDPKQFDEKAKQPDVDTVRTMKFIATVIKNIIKNKEKLYYIIFIEGREKYNMSLGDILYILVVHIYRSALNSIYKGMEAYHKSQQAQPTKIQVDNTEKSKRLQQLESVLNIKCETIPTIAKLFERLIIKGEVPLSGKYIIAEYEKTLKSQDIEVMQAFEMQGKKRMESEDSDNPDESEIEAYTEQASSANLTDYESGELRTDIMFGQKLFDDKYNSHKALIEFMDKLSNKYPTDDTLHHRMNAIVNKVMNSGYHFLCEHEEEQLRNKILDSLPEKSLVRHMILQLLNNQDADNICSALDMTYSTLMKSRKTYENNPKYQEALNEIKELHSQLNQVPFMDVLSKAIENIKESTMEGYNPSYVEKSKQRILKIMNKCINLYKAAHQDAKAHYKFLYKLSTSDKPHHNLAFFEVINDYDVSKADIISSKIAEVYEEESNEKNKVKASKTYLAGEIYDTEREVNPEMKNYVTFFAKYSYATAVYLARYCLERMIYEHNTQKALSKPGTRPSMPPVRAQEISFNNPISFVVSKEENGKVSQHTNLDEEQILFFFLIHTYIYSVLVNYGYIANSVRSRINIQNWADKMYQAIYTYFEQVSILYQNTIANTYKYMTTEMKLMSKNISRIKQEKEDIVKKINSIMDNNELTLRDKYLEIYRLAELSYYNVIYIQNNEIKVASKHYFDILAYEINRMYSMMFITRRIIGSFPLFGSAIICGGGPLSDFYIYERMSYIIHNKDYFGLNLESEQNPNLSTDEIINSINYLAQIKISHNNKLKYVSGLSSQEMIKKYKQEQQLRMAQKGQMMGKANVLFQSDLAIYVFQIHLYSQLANTARILNKQKPDKFDIRDTIKLAKQRISMITENKGIDIYNNSLSEEQKNEIAHSVAESIIYDDIFRNLIIFVHGIGKQITYHANIKMQAFSQVKTIEKVFSDGIEIKYMPQEIRDIGSFSRGVIFHNARKIQDAVRIKYGLKPTYTGKNPAQTLAQFIESEPPDD